MLRFVAVRVAGSFAVLVGLSISVFMLMHSLPGDAVSAMLGARQRDARAAETLRQLFGLDKPIHVQFADWAKAVATGNFGVSLRTMEPVTEEIGRVLPATLELALLASAIGITLGIPLGLLAGAGRKTRVGNAIAVASYLGTSLPEFWIGTLLIYLLAIKFNVFPPGGYVSAGESLIENIRFTALPAITLGLPFAAVITRVTRAATLEVAEQDYIRTFRALGQHERVVFQKHVLRNSLISVLTVAGMLVAFLLGGDIVVEAVFVRPGIGRLFVVAVARRDYPVIQALTLLFGVVTIMSNLLVDLLYGIVDPRIRVQ